MAKKNVSSTKWFKSRKYGWGWTPATWEGWTVVGVFLFITLWNFFRIDSMSQSVSDTMFPFVVQTTVLTIILTVICYVTGEKPRWRMG